MSRSDLVPVDGAKLLRRRERLQLSRPALERLTSNIADDKNSEFYCSIGKEMILALERGRALRTSAAKLRCLAAALSVTLNDLQPDSENNELVDDHDSVTSASNQSELLSQPDTAFRLKWCQSMFPQRFMSESSSRVARTVMFNATLYENSAVATDPTFTVLYLRIPQLTQPIEISVDCAQRVSIGMARIFRQLEIQVEDNPEYSYCLVHDGSPLEMELTFFEQGVKASDELQIWQARWAQV